MLDKHRVLAQKKMMKVIHKQEGHYEVNKRYKIELLTAVIQRTRRSGGMMTNRFFSKHIRHHQLSRCL